jgi:3-dehydroquinate synthetase
MQESLSFNYKKNFNKEIKIYFSQDSAKIVADICGYLGTDRIFIVADNGFKNNHSHRLKQNLSIKFPTKVLNITAKEIKKKLSTLHNLSEKIIANGATNKSVIISLGGGLVGNIAGMLAGLLFRGVPLIHIPTTVLSQADSATDVKQSVNCENIKNGMGIYYPPVAVIIDVNLLKTLPEREVRSGLAEIIKHALAQDEDLLRYLYRKVPTQKINAPTLERIIARTISLKIEHWKNTPDMWSEEAVKKPERLTHLGHTTGKILEILQQDKITHGEAISHGMIIEAIASKKLGIGNEQIITEMKKVFGRFQLLYPLKKNINSSSVIYGLYGNKNKQKNPIFALLKNLGVPKTVSTSINPDILKEALLEYGIK